MRVSVPIETCGGRPYKCEIFSKLNILSDVAMACGRWKVVAPSTQGNHGMQLFRVKLNYC